ncbi:UpxY family transcription antiterminator [Segetibacter koreensis]|uniref:UpxY family transcription antiterminator n=1 Tax=Segetibacter koreensis TaxID=398037 RepID=UPI0003727E49|nr:UpxY family transcription antiterminator [Segetibacter koreensis]
MNKEVKWYAVYTRPKWEKKVATHLEKKGIEHYCPLNKVYRQWSDRKKIIFEPLFTSYVFIHVAEHDHLRVLQTDGVINFVYWLGKPAAIKDSEINAIKCFLSDHQNVQLEKTKLTVNDKVRITQGPLIAMEGNVIEVMNRTVKVVLPSLGFTMTAQVQRSHIEKVTTRRKQAFL